MSWLKNYEPTYSNNQTIISWYSSKAVIYSFPLDIQNFFFRSSEVRAKVAVLNVT